MTQKLHESKVELETKQQQERQRQKVWEQKEHKEWKEREQVLKDELAKRQSELENKAIHGHSISEYTCHDVYQPHGRRYYNSNDRRTQYANNDQGNRGQRVPYNREPSIR